MTKRLKFYYLIIKYWFKNLFSSTLLNTGVHFITAPSGTGKTLLANIIIQKSTRENEFWYTNISEFDTKKTVTINILDLFEDGKQVKKLPYMIYKNGKKMYCRGLIFDEINRSFNRRLNKTTEYNRLFIGLMEMIVTHRHQNLKTVYFLGQSLNLQDTQLQHVFKYIHYIRSKKRYNYYLYKIGRGLHKTPKKLKILTSIKTGDVDKSGNPIFFEIKKEIVRVDTKKHLLTYDHKGFAKEYANLPTLKI